MNRTLISATKKKHLERLMAHNKNNPIRKSVHLTYHKKSSNRIVKRKVDPLTMRGDVMVAFDHKRKAIRSFHLGRIKKMDKVAFWEGFEKKANVAAELGGLGVLAVPSAMHLARRPLKEDTAHKLELVGLGALAAPYAWQVGKKILKKGK